MSLVSALTFLFCDTIAQIIYVDRNAYMTHRKLRLMKLFIAHGQRHIEIYLLTLGAYVFTKLTEIACIQQTLSFVTSDTPDNNSTVNKDNFVDTKV